MSRARWVAVLAVALLALPIVPLPAAAASPSLEWWGPTKIDEGHHVRIPVTVTNGHGYGVNNGLVVAELDVREKLIEAGWLHTPAGSEDLLASFHLDMDSVRVVAMTDLEPQRSGTSHGKLLSTEPQLAASDPARYEVPSLAFPGRFLGEEQRSFDARTNPLITVLWRVPERLEPGGEQHYVVYLDTLQNGDKKPPASLATLRQAGLDALFWSGAATTLYGQVAPGDGVGSVTVVALEDGTKVEVLAASPGGAFQRVASTQGFASNPVIVDAMERVDLFVSQGQTKAFRIDATKPVLAVSTSGGFVPSLDGGVLGKEFVFATTHDSSKSLDTIYLSAPSGSPTEVIVQDLQTEQTYTFEMNHGDNLYPYTNGARSGPFTPPNGQGTGCKPIHTKDEAPLLPAGPSLFHARVVKGGPVSLQLQVVDNLHPIPTVDGSATGTMFQAATSWSDSFNFASQVRNECEDRSRFGSWIASGVDGPSTLNVTSSQSARQVDPPGTQSVPYPPPRSILAAPSMTKAFPAPLPDRPLLFSTEGDPVFLFSGLTPQQSQRARIVGPLFGADSGQMFVGAGATLLIAPFRDTAVKAELSFALSGTEHRTVHLSAGGTAVLADKSFSDRLTTYRLEASRPIFTYPLDSGSAFLAGVPPILDAKIHEAGYRGFLVDISSASGLDPVTGSTSVGTPVTYPLRVTNLGRDLTGPLRDTVHLDLVGVSAGWKASLDRQSVSLTSDEAAEVLLTVTPVGDLSPNALGIVSIKASSGGNSLISDTLGVVTRLKSSFDIGLWFDAARIGEKAQEQTLGVGLTAQYTLVVQNLGSTRDMVRLTHDEPDSGWSIQLLDGNVPAPSIILDPLETRTLTLRVVPPAGQENGILITSLSARGSNNAVDHVTAITKIRSPSDLSLVVPDPVVFVDPGEEALFSVELRNDGKGPADVALGLAADDPSWREPALFRADSSTGQRRELERISVGPGEPVQVQVNATSAAHAEVGSTLRILLQATPRDGGGALEQILQATVRAVHDIDVTLPALPIPVQQIAAPLDVTVRLENAGNLDETLRLVPADLPQGWRLETPPEVFIERNGTQEFQATITSARGAAAGEYAVAFALVSEDGNRSLVTIPLRVGTSAAGTTGEGGALLGQPGRPAVLRIPVSNDGNTPLTVTALDADGEPWPLLATDLPLVLPPRANTTVQVGWMVPADAPDGVSSHRLLLRLAPESSQSAPIVKTIASEVDVGRPDLVLSDVRTHRGPAGQLINATISNTGSRDAEGVAVQLLVRDEVVERIEVGRVRAGTNGPLLFLLPGDQSGSIRLEVDGNGAADAAPSDNVVLVTPVEGQDVPFGAAWVVVGLVAAGMWGRRRRG